MLSAMAFLAVTHFGSFKVFAAQEEKDAVNYTITEFYEALVRAYQGENSENVAQCMDMNEIQSQNVITALECISFSQQYMEKEYNIVEEQEEYPYTIEFRSTEPISDDEYKVVIFMDLEERRTYPPFISEEEQVFYLRNINNNWKIYRHDWSGIGIFEVYTDQIYEFDQEQRKAQLDQIASWQAASERVEPAETTIQSNTGVQSVVLPDDPPDGPPAGVYNYNPVHGVSYAVDLATSTNSLFYNFNSYGGDCTNFVSQCVSYGLHNGGNRHSPSSYYYSNAWRPEFTGPSSNMWKVAQHSPFNCTPLSTINYNGLRYLVPMAYYIY